MAATAWLRVSAEAQQPQERNMPPYNRMPRNVLAATPASSALGSLVWWRTTSRQPRSGSHITK